MRRNTTNDFILPSLREALHARGETAHIEVQSDVVRVRCSNGKEAWVNKILWLDALGDQRHNSEAELSQGLIFALLGAKQVPEKQVPELSAATVSSGSWTYATEQPMGLRSLLQQTISSGRALLRGDRA